MNKNKTKKKQIRPTSSVTKTAKKVVNEYFARKKKIDDSELGYMSMPFPSGKTYRFNISLEDNSQLTSETPMTQVSVEIDYLDENLEREFVSHFFYHDVEKKHAKKIILKYIAKNITKFENK